MVVSQNLTMLLYFLYLTFFCTFANDSLPLRPEGMTVYLQLLWQPELSVKVCVFLPFIDRVLFYFNLFLHETEPGCFTWL